MSVTVAQPQPPPYVVTSAQYPSGDSSSASNSSHRRSGSGRESPAAAANGLSRRIDRRKLQTKTCEYVLCGLPCPFEGRCAFSHNLQRAHELAAVRASSTSLTNLAQLVPLSPLTDASPLSPTTPQSPIHAKRRFHHQSFLSPCTPISDTTEPFTSPKSRVNREEEDGISGSDFSANTASLPTYGSAVACAAEAPPPYEAAVLATTTHIEAPPQYPGYTRYRHNPYSFEGIDYLP